MKDETTTKVSIKKRLFVINEIRVDNMS